jgi:two-component system sensor histidine kinase TctE
VARAQGIDLGFENDGVATVLGEPSLLLELIGNLVDNAIRYAGPNARVTVSTASWPRPFISVADNGPGVPEAMREQVLKRFFRMPGSATQGSGLGLSIVREVARVHGASLSLRDSKGGGLTVLVEFPIVQRTALPSPSPSASSLPMQNDAPNH